MSAGKRRGGHFQMLGNMAVPTQAAIPAPKPVDPPLDESVPVKVAPEPQTQAVVRQATYAPPVSQRAPKRRESAFRPQSRVGKRALTVWLDPAAKRQFDQICLNEDKNGEELLREILNDGFDRRGFSRIA